MHSSTKLRAARGRLGYTGISPGMDHQRVVTVVSSQDPHCMSLLVVKIQDDCAVSLVLNDFCKVLILNCFFVGAGEKEDKTSADKTTEVCSETTTAERRGKYLYQTAPRKYAEH